MEKLWGSIGFENHKIQCVIGHNPEERISPQDIYIDLKVKADFYKASQTDSLKDTVDYVALADLCRDLARSRSYHLMETFAADILRHLHLKFDIKWAYLKIKKPSAIDSADFTFVELEMNKEQL